MQKLQKQIMSFSQKQLGLLARFMAVVHSDLQFMAGFLSRLTGRATAIGTQSVRRTAEVIGPAVDSSWKRLNPIREGFAIGARTTAEATPEFTRETRAPDAQCIYAIGDIHGRNDLLQNLLKQIDADAVRLEDGVEPTLVFLGDYIDRGLQSRQVLDCLMSDRLKDYNAVFLLGNHEEALLRFLEDPAFGPKWVQYGGGETLMSYGLTPPRGTVSSNPDAWYTLWEQFRTAIPQGQIAFLRSMKHYYTAGDYLFVHAGLRPNVSLEDQKVQDMLWIREEFLDDKSDFPYLIVHGHTPAGDPYLDNRRMGLDTGAYSSGILTAARFIKSDISVITT